VSIKKDPILAAVMEQFNTLTDDIHDGFTPDVIEQFVQCMDREQRDHTMGLIQAANEQEHLQ